ncbi:MAG: type IX secretion system sortase PorU [Vicingaceae bacterium]|nr:type IX secretion system sortase PorU [Vicingaceae bacterium]
MIIFFLAFLSPICLFSRNITIEREIQWGKDITYKTEVGVQKKAFSFKGVSYDSRKDYLAIYSEGVELKNEKIVEVSIKNVQFEDVSDSDVYAGIEFIKNFIDVKYNNAIDKKQSVGIVSFSPIVLDDNTGKLKRVVSFEILVVTVPSNKSYTNQKSFGSNSLLASGDWYKIAVVDDGIYKISYQFLKNLGIDIDNLNPNDFKLYGNGGKMLPTLNSDFREDDLVQNSIEVIGSSDGVFNQNDYVLFYGQSPHLWSYDGVSKFEHEMNKFSDTTFYFLTFNNTGEVPKRIMSQNSLSSANMVVNEFNAYDYYERDLVNLIKSGDKWFGDVFDVKTTYDFTFNFPNANLSIPVEIDYSVAARSGGSSSFTLSALGGTDVVSISAVDVNKYASTFARIDNGELVVGLTNDLVNINISYNKPSSVSVGWLDKIQLNARRNLIMHGDQLFFRDINSLGVGNVSEFRLGGAGGSVNKIWDVSDPFNVREQQYVFSGNVYSFIQSTNNLREFVAFNDNYKTQIFSKGKVVNQNLHAINQADMVIVSHPDFLGQADQVANFHESEDGLSVVVVTPQQIYNEFSSGSQDIVAIRDFLRMLYEKATSISDLPKYLLLFGDGSYDNKNRVVGNTNFIPTYQSPESMAVIGSLVSDDYYGLLDQTEGTWSNAEIVDIAIGRLPVKNQEEADNVVSKILNYNTPNSLKAWRNEFVFIGDDEDNNLHMTQSNSLATIMDTTHKDYNVNKIFFDAFAQQSTPGGSRYPNVNNAINSAVESGSLVINYTGHGGETGWAHERVLTVQDVNSWENTSISGFPLFVTATCEFSRFDDPARTTAGELVLLNPGGGIGLLTTVRLVFANPNFTLNKTFYEEIFTPVNGEMPTMGELFVSIKNRPENISTFNNRNFTLLGDPALKLAYPVHDVKTTKINGANVSSSDTIKSLGKVTITGEVVDQNGNKLSGFNGVISPVVFDKTKQVNTLNNDGEGVFSFNLQTSKLFKGKVSVVNGDFSYTFVVPKDISYNYGNGKLSYYAQNQVVDANGYHTDFYIGGTSDDYEVDDVGPEIDLFMNDENFVFGGITDDSPILLANISDLHGINMVGNGIGHDIVAVLDDNTDESFVLNDFYEADLNSYQSGKIAFPLSELKEGRHKLTLKVWDVYNNSSEASIEFVVVDSRDIKLERVYNYPNPFTTYTEFWFEHNQPGKQLYAQVQVFTVSGKLVKTIEKHILNEGFRSTSITWDGLDQYGDRIGRGVYVYRLKVRTENFSVAEKYQKLVILR